MKRKSSPPGIADLKRVITRLRKQGVVKDYALAGALAMAAWGYVRATTDFDVLVLADIADIPALEKRLFGKAFLIEDIDAIGLRFFHRRFPVDLMFARTKDELAALKNAPYRSVAGTRIKVVPLDYLISTKSRSKRGKDRIDRVELLKIQRILKKKKGL